MKILIIIFIFMVSVPRAFAQSQPAPEDTTPQVVDSCKVWFSIGHDYLLKKRWSDAIRNYRRALCFNENFIPAYLELGRAFLGKAGEYLQKGIGDSADMFFDSAEVAYRKVAEIDSTDSRGWQGLGFMYGVVKKEYDKGIEFYRKAIEVDPNNADALYGLAKLYENIGSKEKADSVYKDAISKKPNSVGLRVSYGLFLSEDKRYGECIPHLEKALELGIDDPKKEKDVRTALVKAYLQEGKKNPKLYSKAVKQIDELIKEDSLNYVNYLNRAEAYGGLGKKTQALADYDKAIQLAPENPIVYIKKAVYLLYELKKYNDAITTINKVLQFENLDDYYKSLAYFLRGDAYYGLGGTTYNRAKKNKDREGAGQAYKYYQRAIRDYKTALNFATGSLKNQASSRIEKATKASKKAYGVWKGIEPW